MSETCMEECRAEAYSMIIREWLKEYGNEPNEEELDAEYADLCDRYRWC